MYFRTFKNAVLALAVSTASHATAVTFDALPDYGTALNDVFTNGTQTPYVEDGVTVTATNGLMASYFTPGTAHMDDSGTDLTSGLIFTMATTFDAISFSLISLGYGFFDSHGPLSENILVSGFSGGNLIAFAGFVLSDNFLDVQNFTLGSAFSALDSLLIEIVYPANSGVCDAPCGHLDLDTVVLAPVIPTVPLPPAAAMLGVAGLALFGIGRRKRRGISG